MLIAIAKIRKNGRCSTKLVKRKLFVQLFFKFSVFIITFVE